MELSERDARLLSERIVERLRALGAHPMQFGVALKQEGFSFTALLHGRMVTHRTGQGNFTYDAIARELIALSLDPHDWGAQMFKITPPSLPH